MIRWRRRAIGLLIAAIVLGSICSVRGYVLPSLAYSLDVGQEVSKADYVTVLPGDENTRPFVAAALVRSGFARRVLIPEVARSPEAEAGIIPPNHEIIRRVLELRGVAKDDITILTGGSTSTLQDMESLSIFLARATSDSRVLIVTSDYHARRARWCAACVLGHRAKQVSLVSATTEQFRPESWWQNDVGFMTVVGEHAKLLWYVVRYGQFLHWAVPCALLAILLLVLIRRRLALPSPFPPNSASRSRTETERLSDPRT